MARDLCRLVSWLAVGGEQKVLWLEAFLGRLLLLILLIFLYMRVTVDNITTGIWTPQQDRLAGISRLSCSFRVSARSAAHGNDRY